MYSEKYMRDMEVTGLTAIIEAAGMDTKESNIELRNCRGPLEGSAELMGLAADRRAPSPAEIIEREEEGTAFDTILRQSMSADERALMRLVSGLIDDAWRFGTGMALRGELRRLFTMKGRSARRFYAAFHGIERRVSECR